MPSPEEARKAEAREAVVLAACQFGNINKAIETHELLAARLDTYAEAVRATERAKVKALVKYGDELLMWIAANIAMPPNEVFNFDAALRPFLEDK